MIYLRSIGVSRNDKLKYWTTLPFYEYLNSGNKILFDKPVTFFVGENGSGKLMIFDAIAVAMCYNAEGGSRNFNFSTKNSTSDLYDDILLERVGYEEDGFFLRAETFYNVATNIEDNKINLANYGGASLHNRSHGESFLDLVQNRFRGNGFYILDEPEAALSPMRQLSLMLEIDSLVNRGSQFIIATHSPILLAFPNARIYKIDDGVDTVKYTETEHYRVTKHFLDNPKAFSDKLFSENK